MSDKGKESGGLSAELKRSPAVTDFLQLRALVRATEGTSIKRELLEQFQPKEPVVPDTSLTPSGFKLMWVTDEPETGKSSRSRLGAPLSYAGVLPGKDQKAKLARRALESKIKVECEADPDYEKSYKEYEADYNKKLRERVSPDKLTDANEWNKSEQELLAELGF